MMKGVICVAILAVIALTARQGEAVTCSDVTRGMGPCVGYLTGSATTPPAACCSGIKSLLGSLHTKTDRQTACSCVKSAASRMNVKQDAATSLPGKCGVSIGYNISPNIDCSRIS